jgi:hypothetical protein
MQPQATALDHPQIPEVRIVWRQDYYPLSSLTLSTTAA